MTATNITELFRCAETDRLLRFCGVENTRIENSDYTYFRAVLQVLHLLEGHPFSNTLQTFLRERLEISKDLILQNAEAIWLESAQFLAESPMESGGLFSYLNSESAPKNVTSHPISQQAFWDTKLFFPQAPSNWQVWEQSLELARKARPSSPLLFLQLRDHHDFPLHVPSLYHVEKALKEGSVNGAVIVQLLRHLMLTEKGATLVIDGVNAHILSLLREIEKKACAPSVVLVPNDGNSMDAILDVISFPHKSDFRIGIDIDAYSVEDLAVFLRTLAIKYPLGRVFLYQKKGNTMKLFAAKLSK